MSPQLINKVLNQNWFVSTQMKEIRRSNMAVETTNALQVLHCIENAAAKFIRIMNHHHHRTMLCFIIYCLVLSLNCVNYVNCDIEPHPDNKQFSDDDDGAVSSNAFNRIQIKVASFLSFFFFIFVVFPFSRLVSSRLLAVMRKFQYILGFE